MSYVERAFYDYLKSTILSGLRILLSKRFILFSLILMGVSIISTSLTVLYSQGSSLVDIETLKFVMLIQTSFAIGFILSGFFAKRLAIIFRFLILLIVFLLFQFLFFLSSTMPSLIPLSDLFVELFPLICFFSWCLIIPISTFSFSKNLFSNKITGTILFLGKPKSDHNALFSGIMVLISLLSLIWNVYILYIGLEDNKFSLMLTGFTGLILAVFIILVVRGKIFTNDILNSALGLFFVVSLPNQLFILMSAFRGDNSAITTINYLLVMFSLIYTAQNVAKKVKIKGEPSGAKKVSQGTDPFFIKKIVGWIGGEGIVLIFLGLYLGYNLLQLQSMAGITNTYQILFGSLTFGEVYHDVAHLSMFLITFIIALTYAFRSNHPYFKDTIYRFDFLPPYDELVDYLERIKRGEISKTDIALTVGKKALEKSTSAASTGIFSAIGKFSRLIKGKNGDEEN